MINIKVIGMVSAVIFTNQVVPQIGATHGQAEVKPPQSSRQPQPSPPKQLTEADYYVPLDNWLKKKGSPLNGQDFWIVGKQYRLDPDLLIAITKAETQLCTVKQRGSQFNCGSVGSYDSTSTTYGTQSYRHGIEQIAQTLTNANLGHYTQIWQLSGAHNPTGAVYATSSKSWEANVLRTLSELKGREIGIYYEFRK